MKKLLCGFIIIFFASLMLSPPLAGSLRAQEPIDEDGAEEPAPIERVLPPLAPVESPVPKPTIIQPEAPEEKPEDKIGRELPGLAPVSPPEQIGEAQRQIQQFPTLSPVSPPQDAVEPQRATQQFPVLSPVTAPVFQDQVQSTLRRFQELSPVTAPASHNPGNPGQLAYAKQSFSNLSPVGTPSSVYRTFRLSDFSGGLNKGFPTEIADNEATNQMNFIWSPAGKLKPRSGFVKYNTSEFDAGKRIWGLYPYYTSDGDKILLAGVNAILWADTNEAKTVDVSVKTGLQSNSKYYYFDTFKDKAIVAHEGDYPFWYDGDSVQNLGVVKEVAPINSKDINACSSSFSPRYEYWFTIPSLSGFLEDDLVGYSFSFTTNQVSTGLIYEVITRFSKGYAVDTIFTPSMAGSGGYPSENDTVKILSNFSLDAVVDSGTLTSVGYYPGGGASCAAYHSLQDGSKTWSLDQYVNCVIQVKEGQKAAGQFRYIQENYGDSVISIGVYPQDSISTERPFQVGTKYQIRGLKFYKANFCKVYKNRIFLAGDTDKPNLIVFSSYNSLGDFSPDNFFVVKTGDADHITALATFYDDQLGYKDDSKDCLVIFKQNSIYKLIFNSTTDYYLVQVVEGIGCVAPKSVVNVEGKYLLFLHTTGVYAFDGRTVTLTSKKIQPIIETIHPSIHYATGGYHNRHYYLSIPVATASNDSTLVFNIDFGAWAKANLRSAFFAQQSGVGDSVKLLFAHPNKTFIYEFGKATTDTGQVISLIYKSKAFNLGDLHKRKRFTYFDLDYCLDSDSVKAWFYTDFGDSLRYSTYFSESGGNRHARIPLDADCLGRNFSFKLTSNKRFELGSVAFKFRQIGE